MINLIPLSAEREYQFFDPVEGRVVISTQKINNGKDEEFRNNKIRYCLSIESIQHSNMENIGFYNDFVKLDNFSDEERYADSTYQKRVSDVLYNLLKNVFPENKDIVIEPNGLIEYYRGYFDDDNLTIFFTTFQDFPIFDFEFLEEEEEVEEIKIEVSD